jgi:nitric oxide reductase subunit C
MGIAFLLILSFLLYTICIYINFLQNDRAMSTAADEGKFVWQQKGCNSCHQVYGLGGYLGPDLTNV